MSASSNKRPYGSGSLLQRSGAWYGQWRGGGRQVKRKLGPVRKVGTREGMTRGQAEAALRRAMSEERPTTAASERLGLAEAGDRHLAHLDVVLGRKRATLQDYRIILDRHLVPFFGDVELDRIDADRVTAFMTRQSRRYERQTVINHLNVLGGIFKFAVKRGWAATNPVSSVDRPRSTGSDPDIRFLDPSEIRAVAAAAPDDRLGPTERLIYLTAAMTGLRQGELIALRWQDIDWLAGVIRVRRTYSRGEFGTPKSRRSSRAVPMADTLGRQLDIHFQSSNYRGDQDLVFCHPETGRPFDASKLRRRFKVALVRAGVRDVRFHDLRHSYGTAMAAQGAPLRSLMEWMGHSDLSTTLRYADYAPAQARGAEFAKSAFGTLDLPRNDRGEGDSAESASGSFARMPESGRSTVR